MSRLTFVGLGLYSEMGIPLEGLEEAKRARHVFAEFYTSYMPGLDRPSLERMIGKSVEVLTRKEVEEMAETRILAYAKREPCVFLTPGDPGVATTHIDLRLRAERNGIRTSVIHAASIQSAIAGATGLQSYKFGRTVTVPFRPVSSSESPYVNICENRLRGLHTLALLDIDAENMKYMTIPEGLTELIRVEERVGRGGLRVDTLAVGVARLGSPQAIVKADTVGSLMNIDWGGPPHCLVFPGRLHFMEAEALEIVCGARRDLLECHK
ncbi:MAG: diphthine synthase [Candidatus Bathyarchaeia archaeon]